MLDLEVNVNNFEKYKNTQSIVYSKNLRTTRNPDITIAIPTYKRSDLLKEAIDSALDQKSCGCIYDIIVVDNEPPSDVVTETEKLMRKYFKEKKVTYFRNTKNLGMFGNWNRCFELAQGKWVALLHDDDLLKPEYLRRINYYKQHKKKAKCICMSLEYFGKILNPDSRHKIINKYLYKRLMKIRPIDSMFLNSTIYGAPTCGTIFEKEAMINSGGFNLDWGYSSDWFSLLSFNRKYSVYKTLEPLGYYRWGENVSLNFNTQFSNIEEKKVLREWFKRSSTISKLWYKVFENSYETLDISNIIKFCKNFNDSFEEEIKSKYPIMPEKSQLKINFLKLFTLWYMLSKKINAIFFG